MTNVRMSAEQRDFLLDVAAAGAGGIQIRPDSDGVVDMAPGLIAWSNANGLWCARITARGEVLVAALRAHDKRRAS